MFGIELSKISIFQSEHYRYRGQSKNIQIKTLFLIDLTADLSAAVVLFLVAEWVLSRSTTTGSLRQGVLRKLKLETVTRVSNWSAARAVAVIILHLKQ